MSTMKIKYCNMLLSCSACKYRLARLGTRCCKVCEEKECAYYCLNDRDKCGILKIIDTDELDGKFRKEWNLYQ